MENKKNKNQVKSFYIPLIGILVLLAAIVGVTTSIADRKAATNYDNAEKDVVPTVVTPASDSKNKNGKDVRKDEDKKDGKESVESAAVPEVTESETERETEPPAPAKPTFISPVSGIVIKGFSDTVPVFSETMNDYRVHTGIDVSGEEGEAVLAAADGTIGAIWDDPLMGTCMTVLHDAGFVSTYKGLNEIIPEGIAQGTSVKAGQPIGAIGDTALVEVAEEPHVHFELTENGVPVDPLSYVAISGNVSYED